MLELKDVNVDKIDLGIEYSGIDFYKKFRDIIYYDDKNHSLTFSIKNLFAPFKPQKFNSKYSYFWLLKLNKENANKLLQIEKKNPSYSWS